MKQLREFVILSAELDSRTFEGNRQATENLRNCLSELHLPYKQVKGMYKGVEEVSFMVIVRDEAEEQTVKNFAFQSFGQESVLFRDLYGKAYLEFSQGSKQELGRFTQVDNVEDIDAYTQVDEQYWVVA